MSKKNKNKKKNKTAEKDFTWTFGPIPHNEADLAICVMCQKDIDFWTNAVYSPKDDKGKRTYCHSWCYKDEMGKVQPEVDNPSVRPSPRQFCVDASEVINTFTHYMVLQQRDLDEGSPLYKLWETILDLDVSMEKFRAEHLAFEKRGRANLKIYGRKNATNYKKTTYVHKATHMCPETEAELCEKNTCDDHTHVLVHYAKTGHMGKRIER